MATRTLTSRSTSGTPVLMGLAAAGLAVSVALAAVAVTLVSQPAAPIDPLAASYSNLAGMGGLANPAPRQVSVTAGHSVARSTNLAGMGGLPNPAPRQSAAGWTELKVLLANVAGMGGLPNPAPRD